PARPPPRSTLFPYTTLFRSSRLPRRHQPIAHPCLGDDEAWRGRVIAELLPHMRHDDPQVVGIVHMSRPPDVLEQLLLGDHPPGRSEEHTSELQPRENLVCRL